MKMDPVFWPKRAVTIQKIRTVKRLRYGLEKLPVFQLSTP